MNSNDEPPQLPFWPFILADVGLLGGAFYLGSRTVAPLSVAVVVVIGILVVLGALLATVPFILSYARRQDETLTERQREISALAQSTASSAEQISIAAASLHSIAENAAKSARLAETLPAKLQEKIHEFKERLNEVALTENESLSQEVNSLRSSETERIEAAVATMRKLTQDFGQLETVSRKNLAELHEAMDRFAARLATPPPVVARETPQIQASTSIAQSSMTGQSAHAQAVEPTPVPQAAPPATTLKPVVDPLETPVEKPENGSAVAVEADDSGEKEKNPVRRVSKKTPVADELGLGLDAEPDEPSAISSDGLTRLLVTAYIGIGNKLHVRGEGPGLSWEHGIPLQFVSIGKWRWETSEADAPIRLKLFKNDELECTSLGEVSLEPGHQLQVTANFQ